MAPYVGQTVHYVAYGTPGGEFPAGVCRAAIVTEIDPTPKGQVEPCYYVGLCVLNPSGQFFNRNVPFASDRRPGSWHYAPC